MKEGFRSVKEDELDAFVYDATVLEYLVGQDDECNILTVGSWYAMTGYGVAFPKGSKWIPAFNEHMMRYRENGDLERMQRRGTLSSFSIACLVYYVFESRFWFTGACKPRKRRRTSSKPLALAQFMSAFLLLGMGISASAMLLLCERGYFSYLRPFLLARQKEQDRADSRSGTRNSRKKNNSWLSLISLSVAESLNKNGFGGGGGANNECEREFFAASEELTAAKRRIGILELQLGAVSSCSSGGGGRDVVSEYETAL